MFKRMLLLCMLVLFCIGASAYTEIPRASISPENYMVGPYHSITSIGDPFVMYDEKTADKSTQFVLKF